MLSPKSVALKAGSFVLPGPELQPTEGQIREGNQSPLPKASEPNQHA